MGISEPAPGAPVFEALNDLSLPEAAVRYAEMGFRVFPLQPGTKLPFPGWRWKQLAVSDPATVRAWWSQWPQANIGLALGEPSGVDALDVDVKGGRDGWRSYQAITQERYLGPVQQTPSGGRHLLFAHTPGLINFTHRGELGGLDMRTTGGYIVAAPSRTQAGAYRWAQDGPIPAMPPALSVACQQWSTAPNTQVAELPDIPEDLPDVETLGLKAEYLAYLRDGDARHWDHDESRAVFAVAGALMRRLQDPSLVFGIMSSNPFAWACAERHRPFGNVAEWLWKYGVGKIVTQVGAQKARAAAEVFSPIPYPQSDSPTVATSKFDPKRAHLRDDIFIVEPPRPPFVVENYLPVDVALLVAPGGTGKTTITLLEAIHIVLGLPL